MRNFAMQVFVILGLWFSCIISQPLYAKTFTNQYMEFELPPSWDCSLEGAEWVCQSNNEKRKKEAIIVLAAKSRGSKDSLEDYQVYLSKAKTFTLPGGQTLVSEAKYNKITEFNGQRWVDALHLASEIPGFYTRYLATIKEDIGVVITFSVNKDSYALYRPVFDKIAASLRVFRQPAASSAKISGGENGGENNLDGGQVVPDNDDTIIVQRKNNKKSDQEKSSENASGNYTFYIFIAVAVVLFFVMRRKKK